MGKTHFILGSAIKKSSLGVTIKKKKKKKKNLEDHTEEEQTFEHAPANEVTRTGVEKKIGQRKQCMGSRKTGETAPSPLPLFSKSDLGRDSLDL